MPTTPHFEMPHLDDGNEDKEIRSPLGQFRRAATNGRIAGDCWDDARRKLQDYSVPSPSTPATLSLRSGLIWIKHFAIRTSVRHFYGSVTTLRKLMKNKTVASGGGSFTFGGILSFIYLQAAGVIEGDIFSHFSELVRWQVIGAFKLATALSLIVFIWSLIESGLAKVPALKESLVERLSDFGAMTINKSVLTKLSEASNATIPTETKTNPIGINIESEQVVESAIPVEKIRRLRKEAADIYGVIHQSLGKYKLEAFADQNELESLHQFGKFEDFAKKKFKFLRKKDNFLETGTSGFRYSFAKLLEGNERIFDTARYAPSQLREVPKTIEEVDEMVGELQVIIDYLDTMF